MTVVPIQLCKTGEGEKRLPHPFLSGDAQSAWLLDRLSSVHQWIGLLTRDEQLSWNVKECFARTINLLALLGSARGIASLCVLARGESHRCVYLLEHGAESFDESHEGSSHMIDVSRSIEACAEHYGDQAEAVRRYLQEGQQRALSLPNRGRLHFAEDGRLGETIRKAYSEFGFYVFEGLLDEAELADIEADLDAMKARFPTGPESAVDAAGKPALGVGAKALTLVWSRPLGDPLGGTTLANGRHEVKLFEPEAAADAPEAAPFLLLGSLQFSDACLRVYACLLYTSPSPRD